jgi:hypothetical protein
VVDVEADPPAVDEAWLARVEAHAHAHLVALGPRVLRERALAVLGRGRRLERRREDDEEAVALGLRVGRAVAVERLAEQAPVLREQTGVRVARPLQQLRRAFDVAE